MQIILGFFSVFTALTSAFCAGRASGIGKQMEDERTRVVQASEGSPTDPEGMQRVADEMGKLGESPLAHEYARWVQFSYVWGIAAVAIFAALLLLT
jgi:hypothetical protein